MCLSRDEGRHLQQERDRKLLGQMMQCCRCLLDHVSPILLFNPHHFCYLIYTQQGIMHYDSSSKWKMLQQAQRIQLISKQERGQSTIGCKSLRIDAFLRKLGLLSRLWCDCVRENKTESFWRLMFVLII